MNATQEAIRAVGQEITEMLIQKNESYGNSALEPIRVFSKAEPGEQLAVRIDDKLSRIKNGGSYPWDNDLLDLVGYLHLELVRRKIGVITNAPE